MKRLATLLLLLANLSLGAAQAATLSLSPSALDVTAGEGFSIDVMFDPEGGTAGLGAFDFDVIYDASLLGFSSASFGSGLDVLGLGDLQAVTPTGGAINLYEVTLDDVATLLAYQPTTSFRLVTLNFTTLSSGSAALGLSVNALSDAAGSAAIAVSTSGATIAITAVPEPETYAMLLSGLGLLALAARRRRV